MTTETTKGRRITVIEGAASLVVDLLIRHQIIENQQAPIYQYGFEILISSAITCMIAVGLGIAFKCLFASLLYFGMFVVLRSHRYAVAFTAVHDGFTYDSVHGSATISH